MYGILQPVLELVKIYDTRSALVSFLRKVVFCKDADDEHVRRRYFNQAKTNQGIVNAMGLNNIVISLHLMSLDFGGKRHLHVAITKWLVLLRH